MEHDYFNLLIDELNIIGYTGNDLFYFAYDWRLDLNNILNDLQTKIEEIKSKTGSDKIYIIAHSMGGLLVENYVNEFGSEDIDKLIFVGTPHLGAPKAAYGLLQGDIGVPVRLLNPKAIRDISRNSPSAYQLLPNKFYHEVTTGYFRKQNNHILNYNEASDLLKNKNLNSNLIDNAEDFFDKDLYSKALEGVNVYNISGCNKNTQAIFHIDNKGNMYSMSYLNGDGTVPLISSAYAPSVRAHYYVKNAGHSELPSLDGVRQLIVGLVNDQELMSNNISRNTNFCNLKGKKLTWLSPVDVHIYDSVNNHAGPIEGGFENNISGVSYDIVDHQKFIFLPTDEGQTYRIEGIGTDTGSFDLLITDVEDEIEGVSRLFDNIQIIRGSHILFTVSDESDNSGIFLESKIFTATTFESEDEAFDQAMSESVSELDTETDTPLVSTGVGGPPPLGHGTKPKENGMILGENIWPILLLDTNDGRTVYLYENGKVYGFVSEEAFLSRGYRFEDVLFADVSRYMFGGLIFDTTTKIIN